MVTILRNEKINQLKKNKMKKYLLLPLIFCLCLSGIFLLTSEQSAVQMYKKAVFPISETIDKAFSKTELNGFVKGDSATGYEIWGRNRNGSYFQLSKVDTSQGDVPPLGNTGQILTKNSNTSYDYSWLSIPPVTGVNPPLGNTGQVLTKNSNTSYDYSWVTPSPGISSTKKIYQFANLSATASIQPYARVCNGLPSQYSLGLGAGVSIDPFIINSNCTIESIVMTINGGSVQQATVGTNPTVRVDLYKVLANSRVFLATYRITFVTGTIGIFTTPTISFQTSNLTGLSTPLNIGDLIGAEFVPENSDNNKMNSIINSSFCIQTVDI